MRRLANPRVAWTQVIYAMNVTQPSGQANLQNEFAEKISLSTLGDITRDEFIDWIETFYLGDYQLKGL